MPIKAIAIAAAPRAVAIPARGLFFAGTVGEGGGPGCGGVAGG